MTGTDVRPPIPASLAHRPVKGGLACPWVNAQLADGGVDFRTAHQARFAAAWRECLCQSCGRPAGDPVVLFGGLIQLNSGQYTEPPLCPPCALYAGKACPMVAGRMEAYADRPRLAEGHRGDVCSVPGCGCGGWTSADPAHMADHGGQPAHPYYAVWIRAAGYVTTAHKTITKCSDLGCEHERLIVNGGKLLAPPLKIFLASEPGTGRIWRKLTATEAADHATTALAALHATGGQQ